MRSRLGLAPGGRTELLVRPSRTGGVCVPSRYHGVYADDATIVTVTPNCVGVPEQVGPCYEHRRACCARREDHQSGSRR